MRFWLDKSVGNTNLEKNLTRQNSYLSSREKVVKVIEFVKIDSFFSPDMFKTKTFTDTRTFVKK